MTNGEFAELVGINKAAFSRFMHRHGNSIAERVAPYVYGSKRPSPQPPAEAQA